MRQAARRVFCAAPPADRLARRPYRVGWARVRPGGTGAGAEDHKVLYDCRLLGAVCQRAGFEVRPLECHDEVGRFHFSEWDPDDGMVWRSKRFDPRNRPARTAYTSIVLDAVKPPPA